LHVFISELVIRVNYMTPNQEPYYWHNDYAADNSQLPCWSR
jgi:hypothetical protein